MITIRMKKKTKITFNRCFTRGMYQLLGVFKPQLNIWFAFYVNESNVVSHKQHKTHKFCFELLILVFEKKDKQLWLLQ